MEALLNFTGEIGTGKIHNTQTVWPSRLLFIKIACKIKNAAFCSFVNSVFRMIWKESKWYFKNNIRYTFKLEAYGKLFHFDNEGLKKGQSVFLINSFERVRCANHGSIEDLHGTARTSHFI